MTKGYEAITIQDICDEANAGQSTFYAHYTSKDDLKQSGFEHSRKEFLDRQREAPATGNIKYRSLRRSIGHGGDSLEERSRTSPDARQG